MGIARLHRLCEALRAGTHLLHGAEYGSRTRLYTLGRYR